MSTEGPIKNPSRTVALEKCREERLPEMKGKKYLSLMKGRDEEHAIVFRWETGERREVQWRNMVCLNKGKSMALGSTFFL